MGVKKVALACSVCASRNYMVTKKPERMERLEMKKYCPFCGHHTLHRETM